MELRKTDSESVQDLTIDLEHHVIRVNVRDEGPRTETALLFLHGWGSSAAMMRSLSQPLSQHYRCISIDFPGHGNSPEPPIALGVPQHITIAQDVLRQLAVDKFALIGHSNGGRVSLEWSSWTDMRGNGPRFLVLISPSGVQRRRSTSYYVKSWTARILKWPFSLLPSPLKALGLDWLRHSLLWKALGSADYRALTGVMRETFVLTVGFYVTNRLSGISCPVVLFWGSEDDAITREQMSILEKSIPDAGLHVLEGAGHFGYTEHPNLVIGAVHSLMQHHQPSGGSGQ